MNKKQIIQYVNFVKKKKTNLSNEIIEKDYYLSLFLTKAQMLQKENKLQEYSNLIFKGGTLLTKKYLDYHRFSEDLDFTHIKANEINCLKTNKSIDKNIKKTQYSLIEDIKKISDACNFVFEKDTSKDNQFIKVRNQRIVCVFYIYYKSIYDIKTKELSKLKIEVNFVENIKYKPIKVEINNLVDILQLNNDDWLELKSLDFDLEKIKINVYDLKEIILEKYRAILTRRTMQKRDFFDLFFINKKTNVFKIDDSLILDKIKFSFRFFKKTRDFYKYNMSTIKNNNLDIKEDVFYLSLIDYDQKKYDVFKKKLFEKILKFKM